MSYPRLSRGYFTFSYMKPIRPSTLILLASLFILQGCNPGVFIERLEASQSEFVFPMTGGKAEISLTHGDWIMERVAVERVDAEGWIIDENGKEKALIEKKLNENKLYFYTKGDANEHLDAGYITDSDIKGVVVLNLPYFGYPTLWLRDLFR